MLQKVSNWFRSARILWGMYALAAVLSAVQRLALGFNEQGYSGYENYRIFKFSWHYFITGQNPYTPHPEVWDLYKYSPAFCVVMAPFHAMPDALGLPLWNLLNALPLLAALLALPTFSVRTRYAMAWLVLPELFISLQNAQSNGLMAAAILWAYIALESNQPWKAAGWVMAGAFIKVFGIFAGIFGLFYPKMWKKWLLALFFWGVGLAVFPAIWVGVPHLIQVYDWWKILLDSDHAASLGISVVGWLKSWWGYSGDSLPVTLAGLCVLIGAALLQFFRKKTALPIVAAVLIWVVIFNHKAESPTFIIAMCGAVIWYFGVSRRTIGATVLMAAAFVLSSVTPTDLFPRAWNREWVQPYTLKAVPFILIWIWIILFTLRHEQRTDLEIS